MARPDKNYAIKKQELAMTAFDLFLTNGFEQTTVSQIMQAAGITRAGMYHYYASKEDILDAAIDYGMGKDIEMLKAELEGHTVPEKLLIFTRGTPTHNEMIQKLRTYRRGHKDSYASYRIREQGIHAYIPVLEEIMQEGVDQGLYQVDYPRQAAEFMMLLVRSLSEENILPETDEEGLRLRSEALLQLMATWFQLDSGFLADFRNLLTAGTEKLQAEKKGLKHED